VTLDHIVPHGLAWAELSVKGETGDIKGWTDQNDVKQAEEKWDNISKVIDGIGNLVLLGRSNNASLQNIAPSKRTAEYESWNLKSVSYKEVATWKDPTEWQAKIEYRGNDLIKWMEDYFTTKATWIEK
jgi:hypothetical protein